jgi:hypothetical protein
VNRAQLYERAERAAGELLHRAAAGPPPVDVRELAWNLGVSEIVTRSTFGDGRLEWRSGEKVIVVDIKAGQSRRRFTIAHELGHLVLSSGQSRAFDLDLQAQEQFCNAFAAALLLPRDWLQRRAGHARPELKELRAISEEAGVSMTSCFIRLQRFQPWRRVFIQWRHEQNNWRLQSIAGRDARLRSQIDSVHRTSLALSVLYRTGGIHQVPLWLGVGFEERQVRAEVSVEGPRAIALLDLERNFEPQPLPPPPSIRTLSEEPAKHHRAKTLKPRCAGNLPEERP